MNAYKHCRAQFKTNGKPGEFQATFATINVIDKDGDVIVPGAFKDGASVRVAAWGHNWNVPAVGRGIIHADTMRAWVDGGFFLDTAAGRETYQAVKNLGDLQEWSFGYDVIEGGPGKWDGKDVRILRKLEVPEVSPVMLGAGVGTRTESIKGFRGSVMRGHELGPREARMKVAGLELELERIVKSAVAASAPATRGEVFIMQEMARDEISRPLAAARLAARIAHDGDQLHQSQGWRWPHDLDTAGQNEARSLVARWWQRPF